MQRSRLISCLAILGIAVATSVRGNVSNSFCLMQSGGNTTCSAGDSGASCESTAKKHCTSSSQGIYCDGLQTCTAVCSVAGALVAGQVCASNGNFPCGDQDVEQCIWDNNICHSQASTKMATTNPCTVVTCPTPKPS